MLLVISALISGSEVAFFSLSPGNINSLKKGKGRNYRSALKLLNKSNDLLGTILVSNNFVNLGIIILSAFITNSLVNFKNAPTLGFLFQIVIITFLLLLFGEILPKIYATQIKLQWVRFMAVPLEVLNFLFRPVIYLLVSSTQIVNRRMGKVKQNISMDDLSEALDLPATEVLEDERILKGITKFGNLDARDIMKPRMDVYAIEIKTPYREALKEIINQGYSRVPVYEEFFDHIKGVLYIKDLLPHLHKPNTFKWQSLLRPPYFVPESKKINDLLAEFQTQKIHMAIVIDEYGGNSGIVTLEDILEEIVGEIEDEHDEDQKMIKKIDNHHFLAEAKILLTDFYKNFGIDEDYFEEVSGEADTLAGLILEMKGQIPKIGEVIRFRHFTFRIAAADNRRIKKIHITYQKSGEDEA
ncbi:MAG: gliding motility-associated protein GldE [Chlorobi bacterium]|nr:gliding motility-associated protein GldE [Chlorobiota bacterium]